MSSLETEVVWREFVSRQKERKNKRSFEEIVIVVLREMSLRDSFFELVEVVSRL